jgi:hypothetical protein
MSLDPISAGIDFFTTIINKIWPDKSDIEKQQLANEMAQAAQDFQLAQAQIDVNKTEAMNPNLFVSGWRPFIGWTSGSALFFNYILGPFVVNPILLASGVHTLPPMDLSELMPILMALLGLGGMRTFERVKGVIPPGK